MNDKEQVGTTEPAEKKATGVAPQHEESRQTKAPLPGDDQSVLFGGYREQRESRHTEEVTPECQSAAEEAAFVHPADLADRALDAEDPLRVEHAQQAQALIDRNVQILEPQQTAGVAHRQLDGIGRRRHVALCGDGVQLQNTRVLFYI